VPVGSGGAEGDVHAVAQTVLRDHLVGGPRVGILVHGVHACTAPALSPTAEQGLSQLGWVCGLSPGWPSTCNVGGTTTLHASVSVPSSSPALDIA
jgi:hypothetical protein